MNDHEQATPRIAIVIFTLFVGGMMFILGFGFGRGSYANQSSPGIQFQLSGDLTPPAEIVSTQVNVDRLWEVWEKMLNEYVDTELDQQVMLEGAIKGMVEAAAGEDHVTLYFTSDETDAYEQASSGNFDGIGAELGYDSGLVIVKTPLNGSPAQQAGLRAQDIITQVDGEEINDLTISEVVLKIRGERGTDVVLGVVRNGKELSITITRDEIHIASTEIIEEQDGIVLVRMNRFTESTYGEYISVWDSIADDLQQRNPNGIIIDMRGNPGGFLEGAVYTAGEFLEKGDVVLYIEGREGIEDTRATNRDGGLRDIPVVILVNETSASAAEIFAGALRYYEKATIIGMPTVGKGTAQEIYKPTEWDGASLHLTVQHWLLPDKQWLNPDNPIKPDIEVEVTEEHFEAGDDPQLDRAWEEIHNLTQ